MVWWASTIVTALRRALSGPRTGRPGPRPPGPAARRGRAVLGHGAVEQLGDAVHGVGDHRGAAREHVEEPVGDEAPRPHRGPVVVEHDAGRRVDGRQQLVVDVVGHDQRGIHELAPPAAVDGGAQPGGQGVGHHRAQHVAGLRDHGDVVAMGGVDGSRARSAGGRWPAASPPPGRRYGRARARRTGATPPGRGRPRRARRRRSASGWLMIHSTWRCPSLARTGLEPPQHDVDVAGAPGEAVGLVRGLHPHLVAQAPQAPGQRLRPGASRPSGPATFAEGAATVSGEPPRHVGPADRPPAAAPRRSAATAAAQPGPGRVGRHAAARAGSGPDADPPPPPPGPAPPGRPAPAAGHTARRPRRRGRRRPPGRPPPRRRRGRPAAPLRCRRPRRRAVRPPGARSPPRSLRPPASPPRPAAARRPRPGPGRRGGWRAHVRRTGWTTSGTAATTDPSIAAASRSSHPADTGSVLAAITPTRSGVDVSTARASAAPASRGSATRATSTPGGSGPGEPAQAGSAGPTTTTAALRAVARPRARVTAAAVTVRAADRSARSAPALSATRSAPERTRRPVDRARADNRRRPPLGGQERPHQRPPDQREVLVLPLPRDPAPVLDRRLLRVEPLPQVTQLRGGFVGLRRHRASMHQPDSCPPLRPDAGRPAGTQIIKGFAGALVVRADDLHSAESWLGVRDAAAPLRHVWVDPGDHASRRARADRARPGRSSADRRRCGRSLLEHIVPDGRVICHRSARTAMDNARTRRCLPAPGRLRAGLDRGPPMSSRASARWSTATARW